MGDYECAWCRSPVEREGYTCGQACYANYFYAVIGAGGVLSASDTAPLDIYEQPWYKLLVGKDEG